MFNATLPKQQCVPCFCSETQEIIMCLNYDSNPGQENHIRYDLKNIQSLR